MPSVIVCPACRNSLRLPDHLLGQRVRCPTCGEAFQSESARPTPVPAAAAPAPSAPAPEPPRPEPPPAAPSSPFGFSLNLSLDDPSPAPASSADPSAPAAVPRTPVDVPPLTPPGNGPVGRAVPIEDDGR